MKKILLGMLFLVFLTSCGGNSSEKTVAKFIDNLKAGKTTEAGKYTTDANFLKNFEQNYISQSQEQLYKTLLKNINYKITNSEKQSEDTSIDATKKSTEEILKETLESKDLPKAKNTTKFMVKKSSDEEKVAVTGENLEVLLGKLNTTFSNLNTILPKDENNNENSENN